MDETALEAALAAMLAAPEDEAARLRFHAALADGELFVLLSAEARGETIEPVVLEAGAAQVVLAFDCEERLADFTGAAAPFAVLSGRALAAMLAGEGLGLALNAGAEGREVMLDPAGVAWLAETLAPAPEERRGAPRAWHAPDLPAPLLEAVGARLAQAAGLAESAYLAGVTWADGSRGHLLAVTGTPDEARPALARAVSEAVLFSGADVALDVAFLAPDDGALARISGIALRLDLPEPAAPQEPARSAPGSDPSKPPILR